MTGTLAANCRINIVARACNVIVKVVIKCVVSSLYLMGTCLV